MWTAVAFILVWPAFQVEADILIEKQKKQLLFETMVARKQDMLNSFVLAQDEVDRYFVHPTWFDDDWDVMVRRMTQMKGDCPPHHDYLRLPSYSIAIQEWRRARKFRDFLIDIRPYYGPVEQITIDAYIVDANWRVLVWEYIADCGTPYGFYRWEGRRLLLQKLRDLIGYEAYNNSQWPSPLSDLAYSGIWLWEDEII